MPYMDHKNKNMNNNPLLLFFIFILVVNKLKSKHKSLTDGEHFHEDEYMVEMGNNPAFPLEDNEEHNEKPIEKQPILKVKDSQDIYLMVDKLKPYMTSKNRNIISIFEKWRNLMDDLNNLSSSENNTTTLYSAQQKDIIGFLYDLKPFIDESYHSEIEDLSRGIRTVTNINKNVMNLQSTLHQMNTINDNSEKIHRFIDALQPFMDENQKKTIDQLKNISLVMDIMKSVETSDKTTDGHSSSEDTSSNIIELLDMLDSHKNSDTSTPLEDNSSPREQPLIEKKDTEDLEDIFEEDIFEEGPEDIDE